jgi:hypothetical protein
MMAGLAMVPALPARRDDAVARAERALGGRSLIERVRALSWTGTAEVAMPDRTLTIQVDTRVEPFVGARSTSWPVTESKAKARTLVIEPGEGYLLRDGVRQPLPDALVAHERQQYGLYGHLLLKGRLEPSGAGLLSTRDGFPPARLKLSPDGRVVEAEMSVTAPDDPAKTIREQIGLDSWSVSSGLAWPRRLAIRQDGRRYFTLVLDAVTVELS